MLFAGGGDWAVFFANCEVIFDSVLQCDFSFLCDGGRGLGLCNCSCSVAFWVMANCSSLEKTKVSLSKQEGEAEEGPSTWTYHLPQSTIYFPLALCLEISKGFSTYTSSEGSSERGTDAQNGEAAPSARLSVCAVGRGEGNHTQQCRMTW